MNKDRIINRIISILVTVAIVVSLCAGIGVIRDLFTVPEALEVEAYTDGTTTTPVKSTSTGIYDAISQTGTLGSATNPFVVLEIVPSEDMASFGYLVGGQEPVDLNTEYGYFERDRSGSAVGTDGKRYEFSDVDFEFNEVDQGEGNYSYKIVTASDYMTAAPEVSAAYQSAEGVIKWVEVQEGTGLYSDKVYNYHEGTTTEVTISSSNTTSYSADQNFTTADYTVTFRLATDADAEKLHYSVKSYKYNGSNRWSGNSDEDAYGNYVLKYKDSSGTEYNITTRVWYDSQYWGQAISYYLEGTWTWVDFDDCYFELSDDATTESYFVIFEQDDSGDYVVDTMTPYQSGDNVANTYSIVTTQETTQTITTNGYYTSTALDPKDVVDVNNTLGYHTFVSTDYGNCNYDKYVLVRDDDGDVQLQFCYAMEENASGSYIWHGNIAKDGHTYTVAEAGLNAVTLRSGTELDLTASDYDRFGACATLGIWNGGYDFDAETYVNTELFKKYAIGLAYVDNDITNGLDSRANIASKVAAYNVKVITATPDDFKNLTTADESNAKAETNIERLIDRADLIVINSTVYAFAQAVWWIRSSSDNSAFRDTNLFPSDSVTGYSSFIEDDLSAEAVDAIFDRISGKGGSEQTCPLIFDYNIYSKVTALTTSDSGVSSVTMSDTFEDGKSFSKTADGYAYNVYKLYLLSQQINPITVYNVYKAGKGGVYDSAVLTVETVNSDTELEYAGNSTMSSDAKMYWNKYTLMPYSAMTYTDWAEGQDGVLENVGITLDVDLDQDYSLAANGSLIYNYSPSDGTANNVVLGFSTPAYTSTAADDINESLHPDGNNIPTYYKTRDIVYYILHNTESGTALDKELDILEIEPAENYKSKAFWFWYISRVIPNFIGSYDVETMNSSEFIGNIENLNSRFDVIYIGAEIRDDDPIKEYLPADSTATLANGASVTIDVTQVMNFAFSKDVVSPGTTSVKYRIMDETAYAALSASEKKGYSYQAAIELKFTISSSSSYQGGYNQTSYTATLDTSSVGTYGALLGLSASTDGSSTYRYSTNQNDLNRRFGNTGGVVGLGVAYSLDMSQVDSDSSYGNDTIYEWQSSSSGNLYRRSSSSYNYGGSSTEQGSIWLKGFYVKEITSVGVETVNFYSGTKVFAGETITNVSGATGTYLTTNYCYTHMGRAVTLSASSSNTTYYSRRGNLNETANNDTINTFYDSGDDITALKLDELYTFAAAGYPIIIEHDLLDASGALSSNMVDSASYMYEFLYTMLNDSQYYRHVFIDNDTTKDEYFEEGLNNKSFNLVVLTSPTLYEEYQTSAAYTALIQRQAAAETAIAAVAAGTATAEQKVLVDTLNSDWNSFYSLYYINGEDVDDITLKYTIKIETESEHDYEIRLYIDLNANGRYDETDERMDSLEIEDIAAGKHIAYNKLKGNTTYMVTREMTGFVGAVQWKLEIFDVTNTAIRDEVKGLSAIRVEERKRINVLHIMPDNYSTIMFPTDSEVAAAEANNSNAVLTTSNMATYFRGAVTTAGTVNMTGRTTSTITDTSIIRASGMLWYYFSSMNEFDVHFYRITVSDLKELVANSAAQGDSNYIYGNGTITFVVNNEPIKINMIIIGCCDMVQDISDDDSRNLILAYTEAGNTAIYTHDVTGCNNNTKYTEGTFGINMNIYFRDLFAMDRFDVLINHGTYVTDADGNETLTGDAPDQPWALNSLDASDGSKELESVTDAYGTSRAYAQGLTNATLYVAAGNGDYSRPTLATRVNDGQIIGYPYDMTQYAEDGQEGSIEITNTHSQYFQLDMENSDTVVWYCIGYRAEDSSTVYSGYKVYNDVRNNYYLYSVDNVIYSGIGDTAGITEEEVKLFVNTVSYSYMLTGGTTKATVINPDKYSSDDSEYLLVDYDATADMSDAEAIGDYVGKNADGSQYIRLTFNLENTSAAINKALVVNIYPSVKFNGVDVVLWDCPLELTAYKVDDEEDTTDDDESSRSTESVKYYAYQEDGTQVSFEGSKCTLADDYYFKVPLDCGYYADLLAAMKTDGRYDSIGAYYDEDGTLLYTADEMKALYDKLGNFALMTDSTDTLPQDSFTVMIEATMFYGTRKVNTSGDYVYSNEPISGETTVTVLRRGLFRID